MIRGSLFLVLIDLDSFCNWFTILGHFTFHLPQSLGVSSASLGTSAVMAVALLLQ